MLMVSLKPQPKRIICPTRMCFCTYVWTYNLEEWIQMEWGRRLPTKKYNYGMIVVY